MIMNGNQMKISSVAFAFLKREVNRELSISDNIRSMRIPIGNDLRVWQKEAAQRAGIIIIEAQVKPKRIRSVEFNGD